MFDIGKAVELLKQGQKVSRNGWNGKGMYLVLIHGETLRETINENYGPNDSSLPAQDAVYMKTAQNTLIPWLASQSDLLAEDWELLQ